MKKNIVTFIVFITASFFALAFSSETRTKTNATNEKTSIFLNDPICEIIEKLKKSGKNNFNDIKGGLQSEEKEYDGSTTKYFNTTLNTNLKNCLQEGAENITFDLVIYNGKSKDEVDQLEEEWLKSMNKCLATYEKKSNPKTDKYSSKITTVYEDINGVSGKSLTEKFHQKRMFYRLIKSISFKSTSNEVRRAELRLRVDYTSIN
jgi:hypothetical protein